MQIRALLPNKLIEAIRALKPKPEADSFVELTTDSRFCGLLQIAEGAVPRLVRRARWLPPFYSVEDRVASRRRLLHLAEYSKEAAAIAQQLKDIQYRMQYHTLATPAVSSYRYRVAELRDKLAMVFTLPLASEIKALEYDQRYKRRFTALGTMLADWNNPVMEWGDIKASDVMHASALYGLADKSYRKHIDAVIDELRDLYEELNDAMNKAQLNQSRSVLRELSENLLRFIELNINLRMALYFEAHAENPRYLQSKASDKPPEK